MSAVGPSGPLLRRSSRRRAERDPADPIAMKASAGWGYLGAAPALVLLVLFFLYPVVVIAIHAFTEWDGIAPSTFTGLDNFVELIHDRDFVTALRNNVIYAAFVPIQVALSLVVAMLLYERTPGWRIFRAVYFLPVVMSPVVIGLVWTAILNIDGPLNGVLEAIGLGEQARDWLARPETSIPAIIIVVLWATFGFNITLFLAGLGTLPPGIVDAARVDGAGWWTTLFRVVAPSLRRVIELVLVLNLITAFAFMLPYVFVMTGGGPGKETYVVEYLIYDEGFTYGHLGYASAISLALFAVVAVLMVFYVRMLGAVVAMTAGPSLRRHARTVLITAVLLVVAVFSLLPLYLLVVTAFKSQREYAESIFSLPTSFTLGNFEEAWVRASIGTFMGNSLIVSIAATAICLTAAAGLAFAIVFLEWRGRRFAYTLCLVLLAVPALLLLIPVFDLLVDLRLVNTLPGIILLYASLSLPFATFLLVSYMRTLPTMVVEAAVLDGISVPGLLARVVLPLSRPAIATAAVLTFIFCWNEFIYAFVVLHSEGLRTLPAGLAALQGRYYTNFPVLLAGVTISVLPVLVVYLLSQRFLARGIAVGVD